MKLYGYIMLAIVPCAWARPLPADELPIVFAHSGQKVTLSVDSRVKADEGIILSALGKRSGEPAAVNGGMAEFIAPEVRAPTVFRPISVQDAGFVSGELVVYPDEWLPWEKDPELRRFKDTQFVAVGSPEWFDTWLGAVGMTVERFSGPEALEARNWRMFEKPSLMILGRKAAGSDPTEIGRLAVEYQANVLVLEADWFGKLETASKGLALRPQRGKGATSDVEDQDRYAPPVFQGALTDLEIQDWPVPPVFRRYAIPWPEISNRLTWIAGEEYPLVEEIRRPQKGVESFRTVLSYLPWQEQLGRCPVADELMLRLLTETAKGTKDPQPLDGRWCLLYPAAKTIKARERPVLAAARKSVESKYGGKDADAATSADPQGHDVRGYVIDLRGATRPPENLLYELDAERTFEPLIGQNMPLLILGDGPILDSWRWLKLDRQQQKSPRPGVFWLPDGTLPPSLASQLRVMEFFTKSNTFLEKPKEPNHEDHENEP